MTIEVSEYTLEESPEEQIGGGGVPGVPSDPSMPSTHPRKILNGLGGALRAKGGVALLPTATNRWVGAALRQLLSLPARPLAGCKKRLLIQLSTCCAPPGAPSPRAAERGRAPRRAPGLLTGRKRAARGRPRPLPASGRTAPL